MTLYWPGGSGVDKLAVEVADMVVGIEVDMVADIVADMEVKMMANM